MTTQRVIQLDDGPAAVSAVADYLRKHPDFFVERSELLAELTVPHSSGEAISLVERQVSILRYENRRLNARLQELIEVARENEKLNRRMHQLTLRLMEALGPDQIFTSLYDALSNDFNADHVAIRLFADAPKTEGMRAPEFMGEHASERRLFDQIIFARQPLCGALKRAQQQVLFRQVGNAVASAALLPLYGKHFTGILAIGSENAQRYYPAMAVDLLTHLGDITSLVLDPWIAR
jgi:uncharacterized protein YigA (DUF484 family)